MVFSREGFSSLSPKPERTWPMRIDTIQLVYFSPTGTSKRVVEGIARAFQDTPTERLDFTLPGPEESHYRRIQSGLTIIGAPVYAGRIPIQAERRLKTLVANGVPAVVVVVYGNREYEDALLELWNIAGASGFRPIAGGAFIGEHSFSSYERPLAKGRPDDADIKQTLEFGARIKKKLSATKTVGKLPEIRVPGNYPYKERMELPPTAPVWNAESCISCAACFAGCPTGAITLGDAIVTNAEACILCCACVKNCPTQSRSFEDPMLKKIASWLYENCSGRREPETYI
jgi:ferredoxin